MVVQLVMSSLPLGKRNLKPSSWVLVCRSIQVDCDVARLFACLISVAKEDDLDSQVIPTTTS